MLIKAIVIDDEDYWRETFARNLAREGYLVKAASSLREALDMLQREFFHIALVDMRLHPEDEKNTDGMTILAKIHELEEGTESILITGYGTYSMAREAIKQHKAFDALKKHGIDPKHLVEIAKEAVKTAIDSYSQKFDSAVYAKNLLRGSPDSHIWFTNLLITQGIRGGAREMDKFLREFFQELAPLMPDPSQPQAEIDEQTTTIVARFWSRFLGQPVLVKFGRREIIEAEADGYSAQFARENQYIQKHRYHKTKNWAGLVYVLADTPFEDFVNPPNAPQLPNRSKDRPNRPGNSKEVKPMDVDAQEVREKLRGLEAEIKAFSSNLDVLEKEYRRAHYSAEQYFRLRFGIIADSEESIAKLQDLLQDVGATEASVVLDKVKQGGDEAEIREELERTAKSAEEKGWGEHLLDQVREHEGDIIGLAVSLVIKIAKAAVGLL